MLANKTYTYKGNMIDSWTSGGDSDDSHTPQTGSAAANAGLLLAAAAAAATYRNKPIRLTR